ncbi:unnamed protein product [Cuscuta epithymum]|uniref:Uncharacterized protein n=1 Tax=Cuscuta epithymum TaxID=186058 RepID=A0AAV0BV99_9ASTE|nr:unnamed protein product [Cuscuta epithymum]
MMAQPRRKKWSEAEERTLIEKYDQMVCDGTLAKMRTREKKYIPIALHVNSVHHLLDPISYPWQWTWKDVSTKVQNMRHQYGLVKQKIKKDGVEEFDWEEGITHWSNFLRYKEVFGDVMLVFNSAEPLAVVGDGNESNSGAFDGLVQFGHLTHSGDFGGGMVMDGDLGMSLDYVGEEEQGEENYDNGSNNKTNNPMKEDDGEFVYEEEEDIEPTGSDTRKKRKAMKGAVEKKAWAFLACQLSQLREMETRFEQREVEREQERMRRDHIRIEMEKERERKRDEKDRERERRIEDLRRRKVLEWEAMEKESEERERRRREEGLVLEREREERIDRRKCESKKRIEDMINQHRAEMGQIQSRILHEQQNLTAQLLGILSQWTGHPTTLADHTGATNHYLSQMMQSLHHVNTMIHEDERVEEDNQEDHFIVDG